MHYHTALIVDDLAADRQLAAHALRAAGWSVHLARHSVEADQLLATAIGADSLTHTVILLDLNMPNDPILRTTKGRHRAGPSYALALKTRMERQALPRIPLVALTALTEQEIHLTALAFGCDAVLTKPATPDLPIRLERALAKAEARDDDAVGVAAMLGLLRIRLSDAVHAPAGTVELSEHDITKALLAFQRQGFVGLGQSTLAQWLLPSSGSAAQRGHALYQRLLQELDEVWHYSMLESIQLLATELRNQLPPAEQCRQVGLSLSEYYRRRREAIAVLYAMLLAKAAQDE